MQEPALQFTPQAAARKPASDASLAISDGLNTLVAIGMLIPDEPRKQRLTTEETRQFLLEVMRSVDKLRYLVKVLDVILGHLTDDSFLVCVLDRIHKCHATVSSEFDGVSACQAAISKYIDTLKAPLAQLV